MELSVLWRLFKKKKKHPNQNKPLESEAVVHSALAPNIHNSHYKTTEQHTKLSTVYNFNLICHKIKHFTRCIKRCINFCVSLFSIFKFIREILFRLLLCVFLLLLLLLVLVLVAVCEFMFSILF